MLLNVIRYFFLVLLFCGSCSAQSNELAVQYNQYFENKNYESALKTMTVLMASDSSNMIYHREYAKMLAATGRTQEFITEIRQIRGSNHPKSVETIWEIISHPLVPEKLKHTSKTFFFLCGDNFVLGNWPKDEFQKLQDSGKVVIQENREPEYKVETRNGLIYFRDKQTPYTGTIVKQYNNGQLESEEAYQSGKRNGISKFWYENGKLKYEGNYKDGMRNGVVKTWYENGNPLSEGIEINEIQCGPGKVWHENGQLVVDGIYKDGKCISGKVWDENGRLIEDTSGDNKPIPVYKGGQLVPQH